MEKTYIAIAYNGGQPCYTAGMKRTEQYSTERDGNIAAGTKVTRETAWTQESPWTARTKEPKQATDYFTAVMETYAPILVYRALKTVYQKEATEKIRLLMNECVSVAKTLNQNAMEYMETVKDTAKSRKDLESCENMTLQEVKTHKYRIEKCKDGTKRKVEVIPYDTIENTYFGKQVNQNLGLAGGCDCYDLIQCADLAMIELFQLGLLKKPHDIFECADYVYKRVNALIRAERTQAIKCDSIDYMTDDGAVMMITDKQADRAIAKVNRDITIKAMKAYILDTVDKRTNKDKYGEYLGYFFELYGDTEISVKMGLFREQCARYRSKTIEKMQSAGMYEILRDLIAF